VDARLGSAGGARTLISRSANASEKVHAAAHRQAVGDPQGKGRNGDEALSAVVVVGKEGFCRGPRQHTNRIGRRSAPAEAEAQAVGGGALEGNGRIERECDAKRIIEAARLALSSEGRDAERRSDLDVNAPSKAEPAGVVERGGAVVGSGGACVHL